MRDKGIVMVNIASELSPTPITTLAFLPPRFRNVIYIRRGSYLILSKIPDLSEEDLVQYTIEHPLRTLDIKQYKKDGIWPSIFERIIHMDIEEEEEKEEEEEEEGDDEKDVRERKQRKEQRSRQEQTKPMRKTRKSFLLS